MTFLIVIATKDAQNGSQSHFLLSLSFIYSCDLIPLCGFLDIVLLYLVRIYGKYYLERKTLTTDGYKGSMFFGTRDSLK
jgi:hypothetical protein